MYKNATSLLAAAVIGAAATGGLPNNTVPAVATVDTPQPELFVSPASDPIPPLIVEKDPEHVGLVRTAEDWTRIMQLVSPLIEAYAQQADARTTARGTPWETQGGETVVALGIGQEFAQEGTPAAAAAVADAVQEEPQPTPPPQTQPSATVTVNCQCSPACGCDPCQCGPPAAAVTTAPPAPTVNGGCVGSSVARYQPVIYRQQRQVAQIHSYQPVGVVATIGDGGRWDATGGGSWGTTQTTYQPSWGTATPSGWDALPAVQDDGGVQPVRRRPLRVLNRRGFRQRLRHEEPAALNL